MRAARFIAIALGLSVGTFAIADIAKHTSITRNASGTVTEYTEMVADDNGNLRVEMYNADASGNRGELRDWVVFQAAEKTMLSSSGGQCQAMTLDGESLPGGVTREDISAAQAEMQKALEQMRAENPEMAKMLEEQMGSSMAMMMGESEQPSIQVVETGESKKVGDFDTKGFRVTGVPMMENYTVWAADIDDVSGGRTISQASQGMVQATRQMMQDMGLGEMSGANMFNEILDAMDNYFPVVTEDIRGVTTLVSTNGAGSENFYPACN